LATDAARAAFTVPVGRRGRRVRWSFLLWYPVLVVVGFVMALPLIWMILTAFKSNGQVLNMAAPMWPQPFEWQNIVQAWQAAPFGRFYLNSIIFSVTATAGQVLTSAMSGYAFARFRFPGRDLFFYLTLTGLMIPFVVVMIPVVQLVNSFHWLNTYQGLIVPNLQSAFGMFLFRQYYLSLPAEVEDAATVDGASLVRRFATIALPLARPIVSAFALLSFLVNWNNFLYPLLVTKTQNMMVVPLGLSIFQSQYTTYYNLLMAAALIAVVPVLIVSVFAQRAIVNGITLGSFR
jgi:ABC-type glycerol-3-phosphate transport system permease component